MLICGHIGITTGIVKIYEEVSNIRSTKNKESIDYRMVMLGAVLPDMVDKPLVQLKYGLINHDGHLIAHSFVFSTLLIALGMIIFFIFKKRNVFLLGICCLMHQLFDKAMLMSHIFFISNIYSSQSLISTKLVFVDKALTPFYPKFPYLREILIYFEKPCVFISEMAGFSIIVYFICKLFIVKGYKEFFKYGRL